MRTQTASAKKRDLSIKTMLLQFYELTKPRVVALIIFTAVVGMFLAVPGLPPFDLFFWGTLGIGMASAAGAAINQLFDADADSVMKRTRLRPLPSGQLSTTQAMSFSVLLAVVAMFILVVKVNTLTAILTFASLIGYAVIYTVYLKHATPQNIVIGGAAGAAPPVLGWAAITGEVTSDALLLFLIIFVWTPPHFWALALYRYKDYEKAGIPMLPVTHGQKFTRLNILLYTLLLCAVSILPFAVQMSGWLYLTGVLLLNGVFLYYAIKLYRSYNDLLARRTFVYSIQYLAMLFALMLVDHYSPLLGQWLDAL